MVEIIFLKLTFRIKKKGAVNAKLHLTDTNEHYIPRLTIHVALSPR